MTATKEQTVCTAPPTENDDDSCSGPPSGPTSGPSSASSTSSSKMFLPPDILHRCLSNFCDAPTLEVFMVATTTTIDTQNSTKTCTTTAYNIGTSNTDNCSIDGSGARNKSSTINKNKSKTIDEYFKVVESVVKERIERFKPKQSATTASGSDSDEEEEDENDRSTHCNWRGMSASLRLFCGNNDQGSRHVEQEEQQQDPSSEDLRKRKSFILSRKMLVLDYFEKCPNMIWSGSLRFRDPMAVPLLGGDANVGGGGGSEARYRDRDADVNVMLTMSPQTWSIDHLHSWWFSIGSTRNHASTTTSSEERSRSSSNSSPTRSPLSTVLLIEPYNFIPIRPRGIMKGITFQDQETIRRIAKRLDDHDVVATQRTRTIMYQSRSTKTTTDNDDESRRRSPIGYWILRIISYPQARRRLTTLYGGGIRVQDRGGPRPQNPFGLGVRQRQNEEDEEQDGNGGGVGTLSSPASPALTAALQQLDDDMMMLGNNFTSTTTDTSTGAGAGTGIGTNHQHQNLKKGGGVNDPYSFLVCCWESDRPWEEEDAEENRRRAMDQKIKSFRETLTNFKHLVDHL